MKEFMQNDNIVDLDNSIDDDTDIDQEIEISELKNIQEVEIAVPGGKSRERIDKFLAAAIKNVSRNKIAFLLDSGWITVNGRTEKSSYKICPFDQIKVNIPRKSELVEILPENIPLDFVYQDEYLAVINKQAGLIVHPANAITSGTLVNALMFHFRDQLSSMNGSNRPGIIHRLDRDTTGLMVVAKVDLVHRPLAEQFAAKTAGREYFGICIGRFKEKSGRVDTLIGRWQRDRRVMVVTQFEGKQAVTNYEVIEEFNRFSLVKFNLETGRTHQIRVHMKHLGHPLFGDQVYDGDNLKRIGAPVNLQRRLTHLLEILPRQALHARKLEFFHPVRKERMVFEAPIPEDLQKVISLIREWEL